MIQTYEQLELAASSLIDAVNDCDMFTDERGVSWLLDAVAETCEALGHGAAAHKARHRLATPIGEAVHWYSEHGGVERIDRDHACEIIEGVAHDLRGVLLPWHDRAEPIDTLGDVADTLDDLTREIGGVVGASGYSDDEIRPDVPSIADRDAARDACERAAEITREAADEIERLRGDLEDAQQAAADADTAGAPMERLADRIVETHERGEPWSEIIAAVAVTLREAGRHDAANLLTRP